jgi:3-hydroxypropanoate dehydrogenase
MIAEQFERTQEISEEALDRLFREARTYYAWKPEPVSEELLRKVYDLAKMPPTAANSGPARFVFLTTEEAKARLLPALAPANVEKSRTAPVVVLIAYDTKFYDQLPKLFPIYDLKPVFEADEQHAHESAFRNGSLQGAYFILAARAMGLDVGPMSGFDADQVNAEFFPDGQWKVNFVANLGYGDPTNLFPRLPRLEFEEAAQVL